MIAIIDYDVGNLKNVYTALKDVDLEGVITRDPKVVDNAEAIILPGVGAFSDAMEHLRQFDLIDCLDKNVQSGKTLMGICLGMQVLFDKSTEDGEWTGLGYIPGDIVKFDAPGLKIPHMGWNNLIINRDDPLVKGIGGEDYVYFVHSYYLQAADASEVAARTEYGALIDAAVQKGGLCATQFHPEKSGRVGLQILRNFAAMAGKERG